MKCNKTIDELECMTESSMRWGNGEEVNANLDWDERFYYLWLEPAWSFIDWCEECGGSMMEMLDELRKELDRIGVQKFGSLESVNSFLADKCGDNEPAMFYIDELFNDVRGA